MQGQGQIGFGALQDTLGDHAFGAALTFLGRLENELYCTEHLVLVFLQEAGDSQPNCGMPVMPAGVHHPRILRRVRRAGFLHDRQGVHVKAGQNDRARPRAFKNSYHAGLGYPGADLQA